MKPYLLWIQAELESNFPVLSSHLANIITARSPLPQLGTELKESTDSRDV